MDPDRRSEVSSFYGAHQSRPRSSLDHFGSQPGHHTRKDSTTSSFFGANPRPSGDMLTPSGSAGYNKGSFADAGRSAPLRGGPDEYEDPRLKESQGWDVFADFNNTGPRYAAAFGGNDAGYQPIATPASGKREPLSPADTADPNVELVTVPAFGAEWKKDELRVMTKAGRREDRDYERNEKFKAWWRDQRGCCGISWATRKVIVWIMFVVCLATGLILAFTIPRVPGITFSQGEPMQMGEGDPVFFRAPANFTFNAFLDLQVNTNSNFLSLKFKRIKAEVYDIDPLKKIGEGELQGYTLPAKKYSRVLFPVVFQYEAANATDLTWLNVYNACRNRGQFPDGVRPGLNLRVIFTMDIAGLIGTKGASSQINTAPCPFELPQNSV